MKYVVWGRESYPHRYNDAEVSIAFFSTEKKAKKYVEKATLARPSDWRRPFRKKSLLSWCAEARVAPCLCDELPLNPKE